MVAWITALATVAYLVTTILIFLHRGGECGVQTGKRSGGNFTLA